MILFALAGKCGDFGARGFAESSAIAARFAIKFPSAIAPTPTPQREKKWRRVDSRRSCWPGVRMGCVMSLCSSCRPWCFGRILSVSVLNPSTGLVLNRVCQFRVTVSSKFRRTRAALLVSKPSSTSSSRCSGTRPVQIRKALASPSDSMRFSRAAANSKNA